MAEIQVIVDHRLPLPVAWWTALVGLAVRLLPAGNATFGRPVTVHLTPELQRHNGQLAGGLHHELKDRSSYIFVTVWTLPLEAGLQRFWIAGLLATLCHELWHAFETGNAATAPESEEEPRAYLAAVHGLANLLALPALSHDFGGLLAELDRRLTIGTLEIAA